MAWEINIESTQNGYILTWEEENTFEKEYPIKCKKVFQFDEEQAEDSKENREKVQEMLYYILDYFGECGSKHDEHRVRVEVVKKNE